MKKAFIILFLFALLKGYSQNEQVYILGYAPDHSLINGVIKLLKVNISNGSVQVIGDITHSESNYPPKDIQYLKNENILVGEFLDSLWKYDLTSNNEQLIALSTEFENYRDIFIMNDSVYILAKSPLNEDVFKILNIDISNGDLRVIGDITHLTTNYPPDDIHFVESKNILSGLFEDSLWIYDLGSNTDLLIPLSPDYHYLDMFSADNKEFVLCLTPEYNLIDGVIKIFETNPDNGNINEIGDITHIQGVNYPPENICYVESENILIGDFQDSLWIYNRGTNTDELVPLSPDYSYRDPFIVSLAVTSTIETIMPGNENRDRKIERIFDLTGRIINSPANNTMVIIRYDDGTVEKKILNDLQ